MPYSLFAADKEASGSPTFSAVSFVMLLRSSSVMLSSSLTIMPVSPPDLISSAAFLTVSSELSLITMSVLSDRRLFSAFGHLFANSSAKVKLSEASSHDIPK